MHDLVYLVPRGDYDRLQARNAYLERIVVEMERRTAAEAFLSHYDPTHDGALEWGHVAYVLRQTIRDVSAALTEEDR